MFRGFRVICNITQSNELSFSSNICLFDSTTASVDALLSGIFRTLPSAVCALAFDESPSTVDARADKSLV